MGEFSERQPAWHVNATAANNRDTGVDAAHPVRDFEEITRRLGRGTSYFRQATTITIHGSLNSGDYLNLKAAAREGYLNVVGDRGAALATGTFSDKTDYVAGSAVQEVVGTGLGSYVDKQIEITASSTGAHIGAKAFIAKDLTGGRVRTSTFMVPLTNGTRPTSTGGAGNVVLPSVGDSFAVYDLPIVPVGKFQLEPATNVNSQTAGGGAGFVLLQNMRLRGDAVPPGSDSGVLMIEAWKSILAGCHAEHLGCMSNESQSVWQACYLESGWMSGGASIHYMALFKANDLHPTQLFRAHYCDIQQGHGQGDPSGDSITGPLPYAYNAATLALTDVSSYDNSAGPGLYVSQDAADVLLGRNIWGSGHSLCGMLLVAGAKASAFANGNYTLTGAGGDIQRRGPGSTLVGTHAWSDIPFCDLYGTCVRTY